jgi:asparagine synthetase B (glutamine-hydrolysing)
MTIYGQSGSAEYLHLELYASELRLRGNSSIVQPHVQDGNILCWNGEVDLFYMVCEWDFE